MIDKAYSRTIELLKANRPMLDSLAETLLEKEVIYKEDLERIFGKRKWDNDESDKLMYPSTSESPTAEPSANGESDEAATPAATTDTTTTSA